MAASGATELGDNAITRNSAVLVAKPVKVVVAGDDVVDVRIGGV